MGDSVIGSGQVECSRSREVTRLIWYSYPKRSCIAVSVQLQGEVTALCLCNVRCHFRTVAQFLNPRVGLKACKNNSSLGSLDKNKKPLVEILYTPKENSQHVSDLYRVIWALWKNIEVFRSDLETLGC